MDLKYTPVEQLMSETLAFLDKQELTVLSAGGYKMVYAVGPKEYRIYQRDPQLRAIPDTLVETFSDAAASAIERFQELLPANAKSNWR